MFAPVQPQLPSVVARAAAADASLFKPGQVLEALVLGKAPDGMVALRIGDVVVTAQLPQTLPPGTTLQLQVKAGGPAPQLAIVGTPQLPAAQPLAPALNLPHAPLLVTVPQAPTLPQPAVQAAAPQPVVLPGPAPASPTLPAVSQQSVTPQASAPTPPALAPAAPPANSAASPAPSAPLPAVPQSAAPIIESRQSFAPPGAPDDSSASRPAPVAPQASPAAAVTAAQPVVGAQAQPLSAAAPQPTPVAQSVSPAPLTSPHVSPSSPPAGTSNPSVLAAPPASAPSQVAASAPQMPMAPVAAAPPSSVQVTSSLQVAPPVQTPAAPTQTPAPSVSTLGSAAPTPPPLPAPVAVASQVPASPTQAAPANVIATPPPTAPVTQPTPPVVPPAPSAPAAPIASISTAPSAAPPAEPGTASPLLVAQSAPRPQPTTADLPRPVALPPGSPQIPSQPAPSSPAAALAQMVPEAMARQNSLAPLLSSLATLVARPAAVPEPVLRAAAQVLAQRVTLPPSGPTAQTLATAIAKSGVFLEAGLAKGAPAADLKSSLVSLKGAAAAWLGGNPAPVTPAQQPAPPLRGLPPRVEPADMPPLPDAPREAARAIHSQADSALSRVKLMQMASLPDADPTRAPVPELRMEVPFLVGQQVVMAQFQVLRDREQQRADGKRGWTMRFAMNFAEGGEIGAEVGLLGRSVNVALWAADPDTAADLEAALPELAPALAALGLEPGAVRVRSAPAEPAKASSGHFVDSTT